MSGAAEEKLANPLGKRGVLIAKYPKLHTYMKCQI